MNKKVITLTVAIIVGMIIIPTIYKIHTNHNNKLLLVVEKDKRFAKTGSQWTSSGQRKICKKHLYKPGKSGGRK